MTRAYPIVIDQLQMAVAQGVPAFIDANVPASSPAHGAPFRIDDENLRHLFATNPARTRLVENLQATRTALGQYADVHAVLIGGSLVRPSIESPRDVDAVFFYAIRAGADPDKAVPEMAQIASEAKLLGIDLRLVPVDTNPVDLVKAACYFALLFASERGGSIARWGSLLLSNA